MYNKKFQILPPSKLQVILDHFQDALVHPFPAQRGPGTSPIF